MNVLFHEVYQIEAHGSVQTASAVFCQFFILLETKVKDAKAMQGQDEGHCMHEYGFERAATS